MKRTPLHRQSPKTRQRQRAASAFRQALLEEFPLCMVCGRPSQCVHELTNGSARIRTLDNRACLLVTCNACNQFALTDKGGAWKIEKQLALKAIRDGDWYDREEVNRQRNRAVGAISEVEVILCAFQLGKEAHP